MFNTFHLIRSTKQRFLWSIHRYLVDHLRVSKPFSANNKKKLLLITEDRKICRSQIFPFYFYKKEIEDKYNIEIREIPSRNFISQTNQNKFKADIVCIQTWFDIADTEIKKLFGLVCKKNPNAKIVFLDSFAPTDLRLASSLNSYIDLYVKKHVYKDRSFYGKPTYGDTNLTDYYGKLYNLKQKKVLYRIPSSFLDKMIVGPSFVTDPKLLPYVWCNTNHPNVKKTLDIHCRLAERGSEWYEMMRRSAKSYVKKMTNFNSVCSPGVKYNIYLKELKASKICFSPFGFGEVCWRDYEAVLCGSLLVKPDMSHIETCPDIFIPQKTYIPVKWDFSDLAEKVKYYIENVSEREAITNKAYSTLHEYVTKSKFIQQMGRIFSAT